MEKRINPPIDGETLELIRKGDELIRRLQRREYKGGILKYFHSKEELEQLPFSDLPSVEEIGSELQSVCNEIAGSNSQNEEIVQNRKIMATRYASDWRRTISLINLLIKGEYYENGGRRGKKKIENIALNIRIGYNGVTNAMIEDGKALDDCFQKELFGSL